MLCGSLQEDGLFSHMSLQSLCYSIRGPSPRAPPSPTGTHVRTPPVPAESHPSPSLPASDHHHGPWASRLTSAGKPPAVAAAVTATLLQTDGRAGHAVRPGPFPGGIASFGPTALALTSCVLLSLVSYISNGNLKVWKVWIISLGKKICCFNYFISIWKKTFLNNLAQTIVNVYMNMWKNLGLTVLHLNVLKCWFMQILRYPLTWKYHLGKMGSLKTIKLLCKEQVTGKLTMKAHVD